MYKNFRIQKILDMGALDGIRIGICHWAVVVVQ